MYYSVEEFCNFNFINFDHLTEEEYEFIEETYVNNEKYSDDG